LDSSGSGQGPVAFSYEHGEHSGSIKGGEFLEQLSDYYLIKKYWGSGRIASRIPDLGT
jgi:hypothetical protein